MAVLNNALLRISNVYLFRSLDQQVNVFHMQVSNGGSSPESDVLADVTQFLTAAYGELVGTLPEDTIHGGAAVFNVSGGGPVGLIDPITDLNGTVAGDYLPPQMAALIIYPTSVSRKQGRMYIPTTMEANNDGGNVVAGYITSLDAFAEFFLTNFVGSNGNTLRYKVVSGSGYDLPTGHRVIPKFRTQRRRTQGRGS